ncbi:MAG: transporter [Lactobacillaceae bacterium]|jgi:predicted bacteriocin transport accessory protein|nr:transporter [Lactobacillaceae bacterium]
MKKTILLIFLVFIFGGICYGIYNVADMQNDNKKIIYNDKTKQFIHNTPTSSISMMAKTKQGIYYYGFSTCPWCKELLPIFNEVLKKQEKTSYVVNVKSKQYTKADDLILKKFFKNYTNEEQLTVPFIVVIDSNGNVLTHVGTVSGHNAIESRMNDKQKNKLIQQLSKIVSKES